MNAALHASILGVFCMALARPVPVQAIETTGAAARPELLAVPAVDLALLAEDVKDVLREARRQLDAGLAKPDSTNADLADAFGRLGMLYHTHELLDPALPAYLNAQRLAPTELRWVYYPGLLERSRGRLPASLTWFEQALAIDPKHLPALVHLGDVCLELERLKEARSWFERALAVQAQSPAALFGLGRVSLAEGQPAAAVDPLERALKLAPAATRIHYSLGLAYRGLGDVDRARAHLERRGGAGVRPRDPLLERLRGLRRGYSQHRARAADAYKEQRLPEALNELRRAVAERPDDEEAHLNLGTVYASLGSLDAAAVEFQEVLRLGAVGQVKLSAHLNLAKVGLLRREPDAARKQAAAALEIDPGDREAQRVRAQVLLQQGDAAGARPEFQRLIDGNGEDGVSRTGLAQSLAALGRHAEALRALEQAAKALPADAVVASALARFLATCPDAKLRDGARALALARALFGRFRRPFQAATLAMALAETGDFKKAVEAQKAAIEVLVRHQQPDVLVSAYRKNLKSYESNRALRLPYPGWDEI